MSFKHTLSHLICGVALTFSASAFSKEKSEGLSLLGLGHLSGEIATCSCFMNPVGGLHRVAAVVKEQARLAEQQALSFVTLSHGALFVSPFEEEDKDYWANRNKLVSRVLGSFPLAAANVSAIDVNRLGRSGLQSLAKEHKIPLVSANIVNIFGRPLFDAHVDFEKGGQKYRVVGLSADFNHTGGGIFSYRVRPAHETMKGILKSAPKDRYLIVLFDATDSALNEVLEESARPVMLMAGEVFTESPNYFQRSENVWLSQGSALGRYLPLARIRHRREAPPQVDWETIPVSPKYEEGAPFRDEVLAMIESREKALSTRAAPAPGSIDSKPAKSKDKGDGK